MICNLPCFHTVVFCIKRDAVKQVDLRKDNGCHGNEDLTCSLQVYATHTEHNRTDKVHT